VQVDAHPELSGLRLNDTNCLKDEGIHVKGRGGEIEVKILTWLSPMVIQRPPRVKYRGPFNACGEYGELWWNRQVLAELIADFLRDWWLRVVARLKRDHCHG